MNPSRPDIVIDCNVFVQAISRTDGPASQILRLVERNVLTLHISKPVLREVRATLAYPEVRKKNPRLTDEIVGAFLARVAFRGVLHRNVRHVFDFPRDPDDEPYIDLAAAVAADHIVTRDHDLLTLMTDHTVEARQFRQRFPHLTVVTPFDFLNHLRSTMPKVFFGTE